MLFLLSFQRIKSIGQIEYSFPGLMDRYSQLQSSIEQRLKWAAGANPALNAVQQNFENAAEKRKEILQVCNCINSKLLLNKMQY